MALKQIITNKYGMEVTAYMRVEKITFQDKTNVRFVLNYYAKPEGYPPFQEQNFLFAYNLDGANVYSQAYEYVKGMEQFKDAMDC